MTVPQVAEVLQVSERQVYQMVKDKKIPSFKVAGAVRFDPYELGNWVRQLTEDSPIAPASANKAFKSICDNYLYQAPGK